MEIVIANAIVWAFGTYGAVGLLFGIVFVTRLVGRIDGGAKTGSLGFRLAILPGTAALWPWLLVRVLTGPRDRLLETSHDRSARAAGRRP